jgi:hypothetical protein
VFDLREARKKAHIQGRPAVALSNVDAIIERSRSRDPGRGRSH